MYVIPGRVGGEKVAWYPLLVHALLFPVEFGVDIGPAGSTYFWYRYRKHSRI